MLVVDASVAAKWVLPEPQSFEAAALRDDGRLLSAPSLVLAEIGNAAWKHARRGDITKGEAVEAIRIAGLLYGRLVPIVELREAAMGLAIELNHPIYDCFYLTLARRESSPIATADRRLAEIANNAGIEVELIGMP